MGKEAYGISADACIQIAQGVKSLVDLGIEIGIVIGGGNIFRGIQGAKLGIPRASADQMGMLATLINGIAFSEALKEFGVDCVVMSAISCIPIVEAFEWQKATLLLKQKKTLLFVGGTGSPYFTTDTAAALRAAEIQADALLKATKVDGIYSKDPLKYPDAVRYETLRYEDALAQKLNVMDATSIALCMENRIPIIVFNMQTIGTLAKVLQDKNLRTLVQ